MNHLPKTVSELVEQLQLIPHPEGGYFRETYRSGCIPMSSRGRTAITTDTVASSEASSYETSRSLVQTTSNNTLTAPTALIQRNAITSIYWVPTIQSPKLLLAVNASDHIHYYQGSSGNNQYAFVYYIYNPIQNQLRMEILGPNIIQGKHQLQVSVRGGEWKCGHFISSDTILSDPNDSTDNNNKNCVIFANDDDTTIREIPYPQQQQQAPARSEDYVVIGEAVGPGFDIEDFRWITLEDLQPSTPLQISRPIQQFLSKFIHTEGNHIVDIKDEHFDQHYDA